MASLDEMQEPRGPAGALERASSAFAIAGGFVLILLVALAVVSVTGRLVSRPISGDFELVQLGCAVGISFFLPHCQMRRGNIIVDFFTVGAAPRTQHALDALGALLLAAVMALLAWRVAAGALDLRATHETTMITGIPVWYAYALMAPPFALTAVAALSTARSSWKQR